MITVVIPTLFYVHEDIFRYSIDQYNKCLLVEKIIVIDNTLEDHSSFFSDFEKVKYIKPNNNMFVNPAWNLGAEMCKSTYLLLVNDDILCKADILIDCYYILDNNLDIGLITCNTIDNNVADTPLSIDDYHRLDNSKQPIEFRQLKLIERQGWFMFMRHILWENIPYELKIFFGDDFIYRNIEYMQFVSSCIINRTVVHYQSSTVNHIPNMNPQSKLQYEHSLWVKIIKEYFQ